MAADGTTFDEAITEMMDALREYAEDWQQRLLDAPNHRDNWGLVQWAADSYASRGAPQIRPAPTMAGMASPGGRISWTATARR